MERIKYIKTLLLLAITAGIFTTGTMLSETVIAQPVAAPVKATQTQTANLQPVVVQPLKVVASPNTYLNKNIIMNAKFDKFSTLGLDYKPAFRSSEDYISFLIKRDDTNFNIPLSEMKLFLKRNKAEKFIDLKTNDEIEIKGVVFSDALGDAWIEVSDLTIKQKAPDEKKN